MWDSSKHSFDSKTKHKIVIKYNNFYTCETFFYNFRSHIQR